MLLGFLNAYDQAHPLDNFHYLAGNADSDDIQTGARLVHDMPCCSCEDLCDDASTCKCISGGKNYSMKGELIPYCEGNKHKIVECNIRCNCSARRCTNRVVQRGLTKRLEIMRIRAPSCTDRSSSDSSPHPKKFALVCIWGVRTLDDIPMNAFVCELSGQFILSSKDGKAIRNG
jgi:hypothetical protein